MSNITKTQIEMALSHVDDPDLGQNLIQLGMIDNIAIDGMKVSFDLVLTTPGCPMKHKMSDDCVNAIRLTAAVAMVLLIMMICFSSFAVQK